MLRGLDIRDMLIIDHLELDFQNGLNVLTGETGAGKSILLDSLGFVLGWRGRAELVRQGADQGEVTAWFDLDPDHPARQILEDAGIPVEDELILRRVNAKDGRKTAWINGRRASGEVLRAVSEHLVELHGQHDDRGLLDPKGHRAVLDQYGGYDAERIYVSKAWKQLAELKKTLAKEEALQAELAAEEEFLRHAVDELSALNPQPGEEAELDVKRRLMQGAEKIREDISKAEQALSRDGAEGMMGDALRWLEAASDKAEGKLDDPINALGRAMVELQDAVSGVESCLEALDFNPHELDETEERLFAIRGLARKHQVAPDELGAFAEGLARRLSKLDHGSGQLADLRNNVAAMEAIYTAAAVKLRDTRRSAAVRLDKAMSTELAPLKMERAVFETHVSEAAPSAEGIDAVTFLVATNPGAPSGPLAKIASGGELSRFLLALKVCLSDDDTRITMIFDEIDRGVGGATADAVGRRLAGLAEGGQVLVVTHSPQVAALGDQHFQVSKRQTAQETLSIVAVLDPDARIDEIARMISGDVITAEARAAAKALLAGK